jgi:uncharacterized lipoprotein YajG
MPLGMCKGCQRPPSSCLRTPKTAALSAGPSPVRSRIGSVSMARADVLAAEDIARIGGVISRPAR